LNGTPRSRFAISPGFLAQKENRHLPERDLAWLDQGSTEFDEYVEGLGWAQNYAAINREIMLALTIAAMRKAMKRDGRGRGRGG
jgi:tRNA-splicing ligase RtcB (3'-phosphate/5'-hydroxy nucleic acid ligase)